MRLQLKYPLFALLLTGMFYACKDDDKDVAPTPEEPKDSVVNEYVTITAKGVVSINSLPYTPATSLKYNLFSFDSMALVGKGEDSINTASWDIAFRGAGFIYAPNFGGTPPDYSDAITKFAGNPSDISIITYSDTTFDAITSAPPASSFIHSLGVDVTQPVYDNETGNLKYFDFPKGIVAVLKLNDGRYVKFQYVSLYKNAPDTVTSEIYQNDRGYFTFKYFISRKGSTDLTTK